jgi:hypothetical protein
VREEERGWRGRPGAAARHCVDTAREGGRGDEPMAGSGAGTAAACVGSRSCRDRVAAAALHQIQVGG